MLRKVGICIYNHSAKSMVSTLVQPPKTAISPLLVARFFTSFPYNSILHGALAINLSKTHQLFVAPSKQEAIASEEIKPKAPLTFEKYTKEKLEPFEDYIKKPEVAMTSRGISIEELQQAYRAYCQVSYNRYLHIYEGKGDVGRAFF